MPKPQDEMIFDVGDGAKRPDGDVAVGEHHPEGAALLKLDGITSVCRSVSRCAGEPRRLHPNAVALLKPLG